VDGEPPVRTFLSRVAVFAAVFAAVAAVPAGAHAAPSPRPATAGSADFSVSTASAPVSPGADGVVRTQLTVANNGAHDLTVTLRSVGVRAKDGGRVELDEQSDPVWSPGITVAPSLRLAAATYRSVPVEIRVPSGMLPDIYLLGFVAEAQPADPKATVRIYHRIGAIISVQVSGARERRLEVHALPGGFIRIGSTFEGQFEVRNVGDAGALARSQVMIGSGLTHEAVGMVRSSDEMQLFPAGTKRNVSFSYTVPGFFLYARPQAQVLYGDGSPALQTITSNGRPLLVIPWMTLILLGVLATLLTAYLIWSRRRRKARRAAEIAAGRRPAARHRAAGTTWAR
jgi:hypothetical protein